MRIVVFLLAFWTSAVLAQTYPAYRSTLVNDLADLLNAADEVSISQRLEALRRDTGVQMTVLTLPTQDDYAPGLSLETFAQGLFDDWGIGDAQRNDGVLVLILARDRRIRIELGEAYGRDWDGVARDVIETVFTPALADGDPARAIAQGNAAIIDGIVMPFREGGTAADANGSDSGDFLPWLAGLFVAAALAWQRRARLGDALARLRSCPRCGRRGVHVERSVIVPASTIADGSGQRRLRCPHCDYSRDIDYIIPRIARDDPHRGPDGGFGGGSSGGGGASGRW